MNGFRLDVVHLDNRSVKIGGDTYRFVNASKAIFAQTASVAVVRTKGQKGKLEGEEHTRPSSGH